MGMKFNNEVTISEIAEPSLCAINEMPPTEENVNNSPEQFRLLEEKCAALEKKVSDLQDKIEALQSNVFSLNQFTSDEAMLFYTGFPNYKAFLATLNI